MKFGPITIVAFGDSVTHGALADEEINYETVYWNRLRNKILQIRDYVPVNVINAGIGGLTAEESLERMDLQVFSHQPDLVIISFGLNDVNGPLEVYLNSLKTMFRKCCEHKVETVFLTPNMLNNYVAKDTSVRHWKYAHKTAEMQSSGRMDLYVGRAIALAESMGVAVCDCYSVWKKMSETQDITMLLANRINHPIAEMHEIPAQMLFEMLFDETYSSEESSDTMCKNASE